jgi:condensin complex subunit 1
VTNLEQNNWIPMSEQAVAVIYTLAEHPDIICGDIIKNIAKQIIKKDTSSEETDTGTMKISFLSTFDRKGLISVY